MKKAIFLDRDGVLSKLVFSPGTNDYGAPQKLENLELMEDSIFNLKRLRKLDFILILISNQPDYAKGKATLRALLQIEKEFRSLLEKNYTGLDYYYYCHHHPNGIVPSYTCDCSCRKPGIFFLEKAKNKYDIDMSNSWTIGDCDTDIICGEKSGTKTILIKNPLSERKRGKSKPDFAVNNLTEAVDIIKNFFKEEGK